MRIPCSPSSVPEFGHIGNWIKLLHRRFVMNVKLIATSSRDLMGEACSKRPTRERAMNVKSRIEQTSASAPALPAGFSASGLMFAFAPHGATFVVLVTVTTRFSTLDAPLPVFVA